MSSDVTVLNEEPSKYDSRSGDQLGSSANDVDSSAFVANDRDGGEEDEVVDIDLDDPEVEKAAVLIQAGFKSFASKKAKQRAAKSPIEDAQVPAKVSRCSGDNFTCNYCNKCCAFDFYDVYPISYNNRHI